MESSQRRVVEHLINDPDKVERIRNDILRRANLLVDNPDTYTTRDYWNQLAFDTVFDDGVFEPFFAVSPEYRDLVDDLGNEVDETDLLTLYWIKTLENTDDPKYSKIIKKFLDIAIYGL